LSVYTKSLQNEEEQVEKKREGKETSESLPASALVCIFHKGLFYICNNYIVYTQSDVVDKRKISILVTDRAGL
jgi:hypothetical protein